MDSITQLKRASRNTVLKKINTLIAKINFLQLNQVKFNPDYLSRMNSRKLEILAISVFNHPIDVKIMSEKDRRALFKRILKVLKVRTWTYEELAAMIVALGYPRPKPTKLKIGVRKAVNRLIRQLRRDFTRKIIYEDEMRASYGYKEKK